MKKLLLAFAISLPAFATAQIAPEYIYTNGHVTPINLDGTVGKYAFINDTIDEIKLFNQTHTLWKTIGIPNAAQTTSGSTPHISSALFNTDALVEVVYKTQGDSGKLINEMGSVLFSADSISGFFVDGSSGLPPAIITHEVPTMNGYNTNVYRLPSFSRIGPLNGYPLPRANIPNVGEKILTGSPVGSWMSLYNLDGTSHKFLGIPVASCNATVAAPTFLSNNLINSDAKYEAVLSYDCGTFSSPKLRRFLFNSDHQLILSVTGSVYSSSGGDPANIVYSHIDGEPDKLIADDSTENRVYAIPGPTLEHTYNGVNRIIRVKLDYSGVKYYRVNTTTNVVEFYNANHTFWKSVPIITSAGISPANVHIIDISEKTVNGDNRLEVVYENYGTNTTQGRVTNEVGGSLLVYDEPVVGNSNSMLHRFPDGTAKLIVYKFVTSNQTHTCIYSFPMTIPAGIQDAPGFNSLPATIAPNPAENVLNIGFSSAAPRTVSLYNLHGQCVLTTVTEGATFSCNVATLPRGLYGVKITEGDKRYFSKVVLQ